MFSRLLPFQCCVIRASQSAKESQTVTDVPWTRVFATAGAEVIFRSSWFALR